MLAMMCFLAPSTRQPAGAKPSRLLARIVSHGQRTQCAVGSLRSPRLRAATRPPRRGLLWSWEWASRLAVDGRPSGPDVNQVSAFPALVQIFLAGTFLTRTAFFMAWPF